MEGWGTLFVRTGTSQCPTQSTIIHALIASITYAAESWSVTEKNRPIVNTLEMTCVCYLLKDLRIDEIRRRFSVKRSQMV